MKLCLKLLLGSMACLCLLTGCGDSPASSSQTEVAPSISSSAITTSEPASEPTSEPTAVVTPAPEMPSSGSSDPVKTEDLAPEQENESDNQDVTPQAISSADTSGIVESISDNSIAISKIEVNQTSGGVADAGGGAGSSTMIVYYDENTAFTKATVSSSTYESNLTTASAADLANGQQVDINGEWKDGHFTATQIQILEVVS